MRLQTIHRNARMQTCDLALSGLLSQLHHHHATLWRISWRFNHCHIWWSPYCKTNLQSSQCWKQKIWKAKMNCITYLHPLSYSSLACFLFSFFRHSDNGLKEYKTMNILGFPLIQFDIMTVIVLSLILSACFLAHYFSSAQSWIETGRHILQHLWKAWGWPTA